MSGSIKGSSRFIIKRVSSLYLTSLHFTSPLSHQLGEAGQAVPPRPPNVVCAYPGHLSCTIMGISVILLFALLMFGDLGETSKKYGGESWERTNGDWTSTKTTKSAKTEGIIHRATVPTENIRVTEPGTPPSGQRKPDQVEEIIFQFHDETEETRLRVEAERSKPIKPKRAVPPNIGPPPVPATGLPSTGTPRCFTEPALQSLFELPLTKSQVSSIFSSTKSEHLKITPDQPSRRRSPPPVRIVPQPRTPSTGRGLSPNLGSASLRPPSSAPQNIPVPRPEPWSSSTFYGTNGNEQQPGPNRNARRLTQGVPPYGAPIIYDRRPSIDFGQPLHNVPVPKQFIAPPRRNEINIISPLVPPSRDRNAFQHPSGGSTHEQFLAPRRKETGPKSLRLPLDGQCKLTVSQQFAVKSGGDNHAFVPTKSKSETFGYCKLRDFIFNKKPLGSGSFGAVFKAKHAATKTLAAIKVIPKSMYTAKPQALKMEEYLLGNLNHPFIVGLHCSMLDEDGTAYLVMEYIEGKDLAAHRRSGVKFDETKLGSILFQASQGLYYLHKKGIFHRDIKPANIMLTPDGAVKIIDLGLAMIEEGEKTARAAGTPLYAAPEVAVLRTQKTPLVGRSADWYSLGLTMYYLATGVVYFDQANSETCDAAWMRRATRGEVLLPPTEFSNLDDAIAWLTTHEQQLRWTRIFDQFEQSFMKLPIFTQASQIVSTNDKFVPLEHMPMDIGVSMARPQ